MHYRSLVKRVGNAVRIAEVVQILIKHGFADVVRRMGLYERAPAKVLRAMRLVSETPAVPETLGARLRAALTELGPTFVKLGQVLSTRPDLVDPKLCDELALLQDNVAALPFDVMQRVIEESLGARIRDRFSEFNETPVASASLSQVYRARTLTGQEVAVKVQRPGIRQKIAADISLLQGVAEWMREHVHEFEWMDPVGTVAEFQRSVSRELDFSIEARIIQRFRKNYSEDVIVYVPHVESALSTDLVLTMSWADGVRIDARDEYSQRNSSPRAVAENGCHALCKQVFEHRLFHADPHPGNILLMRNNRIAFLDYGMVGYLEMDDVYAMVDLLRAVFSEDPHTCTNAVLAFTTTRETEDRSALEHEIAEYIAFEAQTVMGKVDIGHTLERVTQILRRHKLQLAPRFSMLIKAMATIESTGRMLDPTLDLATILRPYVEAVFQSRYSPQQLAHEGQDSMLELLEIARKLPGEVQDTVRLVRQGRVRIQFEHEGLDHLAHVTDRASNRIAFSVIAGSLIVGSSLMLSTAYGVRSLGYAGFIGAGALGLALLISILRSRNY